MASVSRRLGPAVWQAEALRLSCLLVYIDGVHQLLMQSLPLWLTYAFYAVVAWGVAGMLTSFRLLSTGVTAALGMRVGLLLWLALPAWLANAGTLQRFEAMPPMLMRIVVPMALLIVVFSFSSAGRWVAERLPLTLLVGIQAFRLPLEVLLHQLHGYGLLPVQMTFTGYNFDILTGASALVLWLVLRRGFVSLKLLRAWNALGLLLLVVVVSIAVAGFPKPFGLFTPQNRIVAYYPWVWLPTFLVQLALLAHLLTLQKLRLMSELPSPSSQGSSAAEAGDETDGEAGASRRESDRGGDGD